MNPPAPIFPTHVVCVAADTGIPFVTAALDARGMVAAGTATRAPDDMVVRLESPDGGRATVLPARDAERLVSLGYRFLGVA